VNYFDESQGMINNSKPVRRIRVFKISADDPESSLELEQLLNSPNVHITKIEAQFDKINNYLVAVWYDELKQSDSVNL